jgi:hypothetical protein
MTSPTAHWRPPRGVWVAVGLLGLGAAYLLLEELRPFNSGRLIEAGFLAVVFGWVAYHLLHRRLGAWRIATVLGLGSVFAGLVQLTEALAGIEPVDGSSPARSLGLIAYGVALALTLIAPSPRRWFRNAPRSDGRPSD